MSKNRPIRVRRISRPVIIAIAAGMVLIGVGVVVLLRLPKRPSAEEKALAAIEKESDEEYLGPDVRRRSVEVAYPNGKGGWDRVERDVALPPDDSRRLEAVFRSWLEGTRDGNTMLSPKTQILSAFVDQNRRAYINFSADATRDVRGGSASELETISSIARTIAGNFPDITDFQILVDGEPITTLGGHISVALPLSINYFASNQ
jgi:hypothetical protein